ncbi:unnamed protein product [Closterium sp. NIES-53]
MRRHTTVEFGLVLLLEVVLLGICTMWAVDTLLDLALLDRVTPASATHARAGGIAPIHSYLKFSLHMVPVPVLLVGRHNLIICFVDGSVVTPSEDNVELLAECCAAQLLTIAVISRCCSPVVQIALKSYRSYLDAVHQAWQFITSTYQATDDLYIGQLEEQLTHLRMGKQKTASNYCNRARRLLANMRMAGVDYSTVSYMTHVVKGLQSGFNLMVGRWESLNEDTLTSHIIWDEMMQEAEKFTELLP